MLRKSLTSVALLFVATMVVNTFIALHYRWPAMFDAPGNPDTIMSDFIWYGTQISPPVPGMLVITLAGLCALYRGWRGVVATVVLVAFSVLCIIGAAGEPAGLPANAVPQAAWFVIGTIGRYAPVLMIALGIAELGRRVIARSRRGSPLPADPAGH